MHLSKLPWVSAEWVSVSANSFKRWEGKNELLLNIKQTNHSSSLFITVTIYICKDQIQLPWTKKAEVVFKQYFSMRSKQTFWLFFYFFTCHLLLYTVATHIFSWWHFISLVSLFTVFHCKACLWRSFVHNDVVIKVFYFPFFSSFYVECIFLVR